MANKKLVLDMSTWRCGGSEQIWKSGLGNYGEYVKNPSAFGQGGTALLNDEGFSCCLGQFAPQINPAVTRESILNKYTPQDINKPLALLADEKSNPKESIQWHGTAFQNTKFSQEAIQINDDESIDTETRLRRLKEHFATKGVEIEVINQHKVTEL